jgi:hypothetical protein
MNNEKKYNQPQSVKVPFRGFRGGLFLLCLLFLLPAQAQRITIDAQIDSTVMWIGHQTPLTFEVSQQPDIHVAFPIFSDEIPGGLEILGRVRMDSTFSADGLLQVKHRYIVTAFEDSLYFVPSFPFVVDGDTVWSRSLSLKVLQPFELDPELNAIADIKSNFSVPFYWGKIIRIVLLVLLIWVILAIVLYIIVKYVLKKPIFETEKVEPQIPPYIEAMNGLNKIKDEKAWQQARLKEYYTELTDVIRVYIGRVFEINAMEMTSEEVLETLRYMRREQKEVFEKLQSMLQVSDLVKFAKWKPTPDESEKSLKDAYIFVEQTKPEEIIEEEKDKK